MYRGIIVKEDEKEKKRDTVYSHSLSLFLVSQCWPAALNDCTIRSITRTLKLSVKMFKYKSIY